MDRIIELMTYRRSIRQWCFRRCKQEQDGLELEECHVEGLREEIESFPEFDGWANFGVTWNIPRIDVAELQQKKIPTEEIINMLEAPIYAEVLKFSLEEQWEAEVRHGAKPLPVKKNGMRPLSQVISNDR